MRRRWAVLLLVALGHSAWAVDAAPEDADDTFVHAGVFDGLYRCRLDFIGKVRPGSEVWLAINSRRSGDTLLALSEQAPANEPLLLAGQGRIAPLAGDGAVPPGPSSRYRLAGQTEAGHSFALTGRGQDSLSGELGVTLRATAGSKDARRAEPIVLRASLHCEGVAP